MCPIIASAVLAVIAKNHVKTLQVSNRSHDHALFPLWYNITRGIKERPVAGHSSMGKSCNNAMERRKPEAKGGTGDPHKVIHRNLRTQPTQCLRRAGRRGSLQQRSNRPHRGGHLRPGLDRRKAAGWGTSWQDLGRWPTWTGGRGGGTKDTKAGETWEAWEPRRHTRAGMETWMASLDHTKVWGGARAAKGLPKGPELGQPWGEEPRGPHGEDSAHGQDASFVSQGGSVSWCLGNARRCRSLSHG